MKHTFAVLSLAFVLSTAIFGNAQQAAPARAEHLSKQQLNTLIASAKTPAEHERIARFYAAQAQNYATQASMHEAMIATYKADSSLSTDKNRASTIGHCQYVVQTLKEKAEKSQEQAQLHEQMAGDSKQR